MLSIRQREDASKFRERLSLAERVVSDMSETFERVFHPYLLRHMKRQFETSGRYAGAAWADYGQEPIYAAAKQRITGHLRILRWKPGQERLAPSLMTQGGLHIARSDATTAQFGTRLPHAEQIERGGVGPYGERYPARLILFLPTRDRLELVGLLKADVLARIDGSPRPKLAGV